MSFQLLGLVFSDEEGAGRDFLEIVRDKSLGPELTMLCYAIGREALADTDCCF